MNKTHNHGEAFCLMRYESEDGRVVELLWNSRDGVTPFTITAKDGQTPLQHVNWKSDEYRPEHQLQPGDRYFGKLTREAAAAYAADRMKQAEGTHTSSKEPRERPWKRVSPKRC